ncbi:MAG: hypothetical protein ACLRL0_00525 [Christensenellaceae bacterium]
MISKEYLQAQPHQASAIERRAISNLKYQILSEIDLYKLNINKDYVLDECNYIVVIVEGTKNIAYADYENQSIYETVQPFDADENKLYPIQRLEVKARYKRY